MTLLREYLFQNRKGELVAPKRGVVIKGRAHMDMRFNAGQIIKTSRIRRIKDDYIATRNSRYKLDVPAKEYTEFLEKKSKNVPMITKWNLFGNRKEGYIISGKTKEGKIYKKIISQNGSCLILEDGKEYFVQWRAMSRKARRQLDQTGTIADLEEANGDIEKFAFVLCRPVLIPFNEDDTI